MSGHSLSNTLLVGHANVPAQPVQNQQVYVQVPLEDGRIVVIPAQTIQSQQGTQVLQEQIQQPMSTQIHVPVQSNLQRGLQDRSRYQIGMNVQEPIVVGQCNTSIANNNNNIDITNIVQSISIENGVYSTQQQEHIQSNTANTCMMKCGSDGSSKGCERLVTDARCGHVICIKCILLSPKSCPLCSRDNLLDRHIVIPCKKEYCECKICQKSFKRGGDLIRHERICHGVDAGSYCCSVCKKNFIRPFDLKRHLLTHNAEKRFACTDCGAKFNRCENLRRHNLVHSGLKQHQCSYCKKNFSQYENLKRHILTHTGEYQKYRCSECKRDFTRLASLRRHEHKHTGVWPYTCSECARGFSEPGLFKKHQLTHQGIKPYECSICKKAFNNPKAHRNHKRIHTGERPYVCSICSVSFNQWNHLKRHKAVHEKNATNSLDDCQLQGFATQKRKIWKKKGVDPEKPKSPLSAYFLWFMDARESILKADPTMKMPELAKQGGKLWKTINDEERQFYEQKAIEEREKYKLRLQRWRDQKSLECATPVRSTSDMCVGTETDLPTSSTPKKGPDGKPILTEYAGQPSFDSSADTTQNDVVNLLENASRSIGLHSFQMDSEPFDLYETSSSTAPRTLPSTTTAFPVTVTSSYEAPSGYVNASSYTQDAPSFSNTVNRNTFRTFGDRTTPRTFNNQPRAGPFASQFNTQYTFESDTPNNMLDFSNRDSDNNASLTIDNQTLS